MRNHTVLPAARTFNPQVEWAIPAFTCRLPSILRTCRRIGDRAFSVAAPRARNRLLRQTWNCCGRQTIFTENWKHFCLSPYSHRRDTPTEVLSIIDSDPDRTSGNMLTCLVMCPPSTSSRCNINTLPVLLYPVYTIPPVVKPRCTTGLNEQTVRSTWLSNRVYNPVWQQVVSSKKGALQLLCLNALVVAVTSSCISVDRSVIESSFVWVCLCVYAVHVFH